MINTGIPKILDYTQFYNSCHIRHEAIDQNFKALLLVISLKVKLVKHTEDHFQPPPQALLANGLRGTSLPTTLFNHVLILSRQRQLCYSS